MDPVRFFLNKSVSFFEYKDIRSYLGSRISLECSIRKSHSAKKFSPFSKKLTNRLIYFIHSSFGCYKCNYSTRTYLIKCFSKEVIMDKKIMLIIFFILNLILSKRYISDCNIKEIIRICGLFKSFNLNICLRIKLSCNTSTDTIKFHSIKSALLHTLREHTEKITNTH